MKVRRLHTFALPLYFRVVDGWLEPGRPTNDRLVFDALPILDGWSSGYTITCHYEGGCGLRKAPAYPGEPTGGIFTHGTTAHADDHVVVMHTRADDASGAVVAINM